MSRLTDWWRHLEFFDVQRPRLWQGVIICGCIAAIALILLAL